MELEFCPTLEHLYRTREAIGRSGKPFSLTGGLSTVNNLLTIRQLMLQSNSLRTMEIGMGCGGSALTFAATHRDLKHPPSHPHIAIDGFQLTGFDDVGRLKLEAAGLSDYVEVREDLSSVALPRMVEDNLRFEIIYIDGSHRFEDVFCDFYFARSLLSVGGYLMFDDSSDFEVAKVVRFIRKNLSGFFKSIPIARFRSGSIFEQLKYTVGEALYRTQLAMFQKIRDGDRLGQCNLRSF